MVPKNLSASAASARKAKEFASREHEHLQHRKHTIDANAYLNYANVFCSTTVMSGENKRTRQSISARFNLMFMLRSFSRGANSYASAYTHAPLICYLASENQA